MTPAIRLLNRKEVWHKIHQYQHDKTVQSYGEEASEKLGIDANSVFKTLVTQCDSLELVVAIIPVSKKLNLKLMAKAIGAKKVKMAAKHDVEKATGYVLGGISPLGQKKRLRTFIDSSANNQDKIFVSAGRRGLELEISPSDLCTVINGRFSNLT